MDRELRDSTKRGVPRTWNDILAETDFAGYFFFARRFPKAQKSRKTLYRTNTRSEIVERCRPDENIHAARDGWKFVCLNGISIIVSLLYSETRRAAGKKNWRALWTRIKMGGKNRIYMGRERFLCSERQKTWGAVPACNPPARCYRTKFPCRHHGPISVKARRPRSSFERLRTKNARRNKYNADMTRV